MFGHSPPSEPKDGEDRGTVTSLSTNDKDGGNDNAGNGPNGASADGSSSGGEKRHSLGDASTGRRSTDDAVVSGEKKRRSGKASSLLASARSSLHLSGSSASAHLSAPSTAEPEDDQQNPIQQLGKQDPALAVPQGPHNNSAGESLPGARSTFSVGVTEDRNKKCRRTMEDTHSYLYNFLNTPAPHLHGQPAAAACDPDADASDTADPASKVVETDNGYFAIFDGHAGTFAADWCGKKLHSILEDAIRKHPNTPIPELLDQTFVTVDHELEKLPLKNSGCTAVIAVLRWEDRIPGGQSATGSSALGPAAAAAAAAAAATSQPGGGGVDAASQPGQGQPTNARSNEGSHASPSASNATSRLQQGASRQRVLYTANVGDARIVLCRNGKALRLSYDHKGSDENEGKRVANAGGLILNNRVNGVLAVTRALGDAYMKDLVTGHPYTTETVIKPDMDEFIVLACDGLWDVCEDQEAVDLVRNVQDPQAASKVLVDHALSRFSTDNLSCMIVRLDSSALRNRVERRADPIGVEGDPGMAKPGGISEADAKVLEAKEKVLREEGKGPHSQQPNGKEKASSQAPTHDQPGREEAGTTKGGENAVEGSSSSGNEARNGGAPGTGGGNAATTLSFVSNPTTEPRQDQEAGSGAGNEGSSTSTS